MFPMKTAAEVLQETEMPVFSYANPTPSRRSRKKETLFGWGNIQTGALGIVNNDGSVSFQKRVSNPRKIHLYKAIRSISLILMYLLLQIHQWMYESVTK